MYDVKNVTYGEFAWICTIGEDSFRPCMGHGCIALYVSGVMPALGILRMGWFLFPSLVLPSPCFRNRRAVSMPSMPSMPLSVVLSIGLSIARKGVRPALCEGPSRHMREYYLRCLVDSLLRDRLREAAEVNSRTGGGGVELAGELLCSSGLIFTAAGV